MEEAKVNKRGAGELEQKQQKKQKVQDTKSSSFHPLTLSEIEQDRLYGLSTKHWKDGHAETIDLELIKIVYENEIQQQHNRKITLLEVTQYLEYYLWPGYLKNYFQQENSKHASKEHLLSMIILLNEKFDEGVDAWEAVASKQDEFQKFFEDVLQLRQSEELSIQEKTSYLLFLINTFQSLENAVVRTEVLKLVGFQLWLALSPGRLKLELFENQELVKVWKRLQKREAKEKKETASKGETFTPFKDRLAVKFLPSIISDFLHILNQIQFEEQQPDETFKIPPNQNLNIHYCERFVEFLTDLLSQLPTRRFLHAVVDESAVVIQCKMSQLYWEQQKISNQNSEQKNDDNFATFYALTNRLHNTLRHPVHDHTGELLSDDRMLQQSYDQICQLQRLLLKYYPKQLSELAFAPCKEVGRRPLLEKQLKKLSTDQLRKLVCRQLRLFSDASINDDSEASNLMQDSDENQTELDVGFNPDFLRELLIDKFEIRNSQRQTISQMPLYPTETQLFDTRTIPGEKRQKQGSKEEIFPLPIPKLNLQFLSLYDHLLRNFELYALESAHQIREDVSDVVKRMNVDYGKEGEVVFRGWARMGAHIQHFSVSEVHQAAVGQNIPSKVLADVVYSVKGMRPEIKAEWDQLKQHDVLYLLAVQPPKQTNGVSGGGGDSVDQMKSGGLLYARGCEIVEIRDEVGELMNDYTGATFRKLAAEQQDGEQPINLQITPTGQTRKLQVQMDAAQYQIDVDNMVAGGIDVYKSFNLLMRRRAKENNFKAVLESIRELMNGDCRLPDWFLDIFLGYGDPSSASMQHTEEQLLHEIDFKDTFLDAQHVVESFPQFKVEFETEQLPMPPYRAVFPQGFGSSFQYDIHGDEIEKEKKELVDKARMKVYGYSPPNPGPYPQDVGGKNCVRFTPVQMRAIVGGIQPGLTLVVGPPGTGKTDVATQILQLLLANHPGQRALLVAHSNQALNDLFAKIAARDLQPRYLLRLGLGEAELETEHDFSRTGRVNAALMRRIELLARVEKLAKTLNLSNESNSTCEGAGYFWLTHVLARIERFLDECQKKSGDKEVVANLFPFKDFFSDASQPLFKNQSYEEDYEVALGCIRHLQNIFKELEEIRAFELLKGQADRVNYLMTKQAKIVAMTCTHAALKRAEFMKVGLQYDTLVMEESAQVMEIETLIPMLLQKQNANMDSNKPRLKRIILIGDHGQLPPVIKNRAFQKYSHLDQSLFTRLIRLNVPRVTLDAQGRCRPSIAQLFNWRYGGLKDLPAVLSPSSSYAFANPGFLFDYQFINVPDYMGQGEYQPTPFFYQNLGEAEYVVSVYQYMRLLGYPSNKITILTTYNGQKHLIRDVIEKRCANNAVFGKPQKVTTVDKFQGQQNDYVLLSLVRTRAVGHIRDVRRLVVACSRARLGFYVFGRESLFSSYGELKPTMQRFSQRPLQLCITPHEFYENVSLPCSRPVSYENVQNIQISGMEALNPVILNLTQSYQSRAAAFPNQMGDVQMQDIGNNGQQK